MLSPDQQAAYDRDGFVILRRAVPAQVVAPMRDRLWQTLERRYGAWPDAPDTWPAGGVHRLQVPARSGAFDALAAPSVVGAIDALLGAGTWDPPEHWGQPLVTFPTPGPWVLPSRMWHMDYPVRGRPGPRFAVKLLVLLAPLESRGGATLLVERSHRLVQRYAEAAPPDDPGNSSQVRARLAERHAWLADLMARDAEAAPERVQRFMVDGTEIDGVRVRVAEFTGEAGDVLLFHPWLLHAPSANVRDTPRMMLGQNLTTRAGLRVYARPGARDAAAVRSERVQLH